MGFIYMLTSPSNKSYIGQTIRSIEERFKEHQKSSSNCVAIYGAIQKHGWDNFEKHWYEVPEEELNQHEELMVEVLGTLVPDGYNMKEGGGNGKMCEEVKKKISESLTGRTLSDDHRQNLSIALSDGNHPMFGKTHTDDAKQNMSAAKSGENNPMFGKTLTDNHKQKLSDANSGENHPFYGQTLTDEHKQNISKGLTGKTHTDEHKQNISKGLTGEKNHMSKTMYQYDLDGTFVQSFASGGEAVRSLNKTDGTLINRCARGERPSAYGFKWSYTKLYI
ncbi:GIY-YIG catalytic domain-containing endonuclease [Acanthocystis turfacea Chlorella virus GM0701.1]|nr:GIY-YIG catalytic domain-containing endonuclease [Acanthocystis turfacea Chlorella virus GM0701.1]